MQKTLAEHIQRVLETLALAETQAATVQAMMREQRLFFGLDYDSPRRTSLTSKARCATCISSPSSAGK